MPLHPKLVPLLQGLCQATAKGKLQWKEPKQVSGLYEARLKEALLTLDRSDDRVPTTYSLTITSEHAQEYVEVGGGDDAYDLIRELYTMAGTGSGRADELFDKVIAELNMATS